MQPHSEGWSSGALRGHGQYSGRAATINREDQHKTLTDRISLKFYLQRKNSQTDFWEEVFYLFTFINTELITRNYTYNLKRLKEKVFPKI